MTCKILNARTLTGKAFWQRAIYNLDVTAIGSQTSIQFATVKLLDYADGLENLLQDANPFALVTAAHLFTQQTRENTLGRYEAKWRLARLLYERDWDKQRILDLFAIIDWLMRLPDDLDLQLWTSIQNLERNKTMPYVLSIERIARQEGFETGLQEGRQVGLQEGLQEGRQAEARALLKRLLTKKFGPLTAEWETHLASAALDQLETWGENLLVAPDLEAVLGERRD